jgi:hypothetical protein
LISLLNVVVVIGEDGISKSQRVDSGGVNPEVPVNCLEINELLAHKTGSRDVGVVIVVQHIYVSTRLLVLSDPASEETLELVSLLVLVHEALKVPEELETFLIRHVREGVIGVRAVKNGVETGVRVCRAKGGKIKSQVLSSHEHLYGGKVLSVLHC